MMTFEELRATGENIRVHGNGFIQIDMPDGSRVHCWGHPDIPRQRQASQIHDHSFDFTSEILAGSLVNAVYYTKRGVDPTHDVYRPTTRDRQDTVLEKVGQISVTPVSIKIYTPGMSYLMITGELHETFANQPTVTHMCKTGEAAPRYSPRVLLPIGRLPDNEFNRYAFSENRLWLIVKDCFDLG